MNTSICGAFLNCTETIGKVFATGTDTTTGSIFMTLLVLLFVILAIAVMFGIPIEYTAVLVLPLLLAYTAFVSDFASILVITLLYLGVIVAKNFIIR